MAKRKAKQKIKKNDIQYSKRSRKNVNYAETTHGSDDNKNSDSDFEVDRKQEKSQISSNEEPGFNKEIVKKTQKKNPRKSYLPNSPKHENSLLFTTQPGIIKRPNLSEDESSDSSDDDIPISRLKKVTTPEDVKHFDKVNQDKYKIGINHVPSSNDELHSKISDVIEIASCSVAKNLQETVEIYDSTKVCTSDKIDQKGKIAGSFDTTNLQDTVQINDSTKLGTSEKIDQKGKNACGGAAKNLKGSVELNDNTKLDTSEKMNQKGKKRNKHRISGNEIPGKMVAIESNKQSEGKALRPKRSLPTKNINKTNLETVKPSDKKKKRINKHNSKADTTPVMLTNVVSKDKTFSSSDDESADDGWEDVDEAKIKLSPKKKKVKTEEEKIEEKGLEITDLKIKVGVQSIHKKKKSREEKMFIWMRQIIGRFQKERQVFVHKNHLLCLLAKAIRENIMCNNDILKSICLSLVANEFLKPVSNKWDISHLRKFVVWFQKDIPSIDELLLFIDHEAAAELKHLKRVHIFVLILRSLGFSARLIFSLQPCTAKVKRPGGSPSSPLSPNTTKELPAKEEKKNSQEKSKAITKLKSEDHRKNQEKSKPSEKIKPSPLKKEKAIIESPYFHTPHSNNRNKAETKTNRGNSKLSVCKNKPEKGIKKDDQTNKKQLETVSSKMHNNRRKLKRVSYNEHTTENESTDDTDKHKLKKKISQKDDADDDDFDLTSEVQHTRIPKNTPVRTKHKETEEEKTPKSVRKTSGKMKARVIGTDIWVEVYLKNMNSWISVELTTESINEPYKCESIATKPLQYVIGIDNDKKIKDVTCRYAEKWLSSNRKLRIDREWWAETLEPYKPPINSRNNAEDAQLKKTLLQQDFPTSISEFKDNPLYVLKRHLLKFQAIYPESAVPLGYIRKEAIYSRDCVYELHTRETWLKQARTVKQGEVPYKIVKGRPKRNTPVTERNNLKVEVFGLWQSEIYVPPPVVDGKITKNEYGNVELFQASMLPEGAVHLPMNNMQKIARKLNIDYAPAMMGWDFHGGWSHPVFEGIVAAKEFEDILLDAWREEEEINRKKEKEKRERIIYENWKSLIRGILIRHKLKSKYNFEEEQPKPVPKTKKKQSKVNTKKKTSPKSSKDEYNDLSVSWPMNRMGGTASLAVDGHVHVFPESSHKTNSVNGVVTKSCSCGLEVPLDTVEKL